jgi:hypothetical protein
MKHHIMTRLQQYEPSHLDVGVALRLDALTTANGLSPNDNSQQGKGTGWHCKEGADDRRSLISIQKFFINFNNEVAVKHWKVEEVKLRPRRKLEHELSSMLSLKEDKSKPTKLVSAFDSSEKENIPMNYHSVVTEQDCGHVRAGYYFQQKEKPKVKKINSLVILRN